MYNIFIRSIGDLPIKQVLKYENSSFTQDSFKSSRKCFEIKKNAVTVMQGIYLKKGKAEIFITIGQVKLITVFFKGRTELLLTALKHDSMDEAEHQAKDFIEQINEVLEEVEKRN